MTPSLPETVIFRALGQFLEAILPGGVAVIQGQDNRVPAPETDDYVVMWPTSRTRLSTNRKAYDSTAGTAILSTPTQASVQVDIHGSSCADNMQVFTTLFRDSYGVDFFNTLDLGVTPLYCDDGRQVPFINGQKQFENRWTVYAEFQINPSVSTSQQFADTFEFTLIEADTL